MSVIGRDELDAVAMAHRAYCQSVPGMPWTRLADGEYKAIIRAAQPQGAVGALEEARALIETAEQDGYVGEGWREDARRWAACWADTLGGQ